MGSLADMDDGLHEVNAYNLSEGAKVMEVRIEDSCTACGICVDTCPDVFVMGDELAQVSVDKVPAELEETVQQAADECPVEAIVVV